MSDLIVYRFYSYVEVEVKNCNEVVLEDLVLYRKHTYDAYLTKETRRQYKDNRSLVDLYKRFMCDDVDYSKSLECVEEVKEYEFVYFDSDGFESDALLVLNQIVIDGNYTCNKGVIPVFHKWEYRVE
jgi:hypothetical protein